MRRYSDEDEMTEAPAAGGSLRVGRGSMVWTLAGLIVLAVNLRTAISGVSPLLDDLQRAFGLPSSAMGALTTLPVLCLGAFAAIAPVLARRVGTGVALAGALTLLASGILVRLAPAPAALFAGTAMVGAGIAIGNVLMPYVIKSAFPQRIGGLTGMAMMLMSSGAALSAGLAVPLLDVGGWRLPMAVWAVPALIGLAVWAPLAVRLRARDDERTKESVADEEAATATGSLLRNPLAWAVTIFMGMQSLMFYVVMSWLPAIMRDNGYAPATAGMMLSVMMLLGIPTGLLMPMLAARSRDQRPLVIVVMALLALAFGGLLMAPHSGWVWIVLLGVGAGSAFPLAFTLISLRSPSPRIAARLSGMAQTTGYLLAGLGPFLFGTLQHATGSWRMPLLVLLVWIVPETVIALRAARPGFVRPGTGPVESEEERPELLVEPKGVDVEGEPERRRAGLSRR